MTKALFLFLVLFIACLAFGQRPVKNIVKPNDVVRVHCDEEPALDKEYTITHDGFIVMQYVGAVQVSGLSEDEAAGKIAQALVDEHIVSKASVGLTISSTKQGVVSFGGAVSSSGQLPARDGLRLSDVIQEAHPNANANLQRVRITTASGNQFFVNYSTSDGSGDSNNPELRSGDSVYFDTTSTPAVQPSGTGVARTSRRRRSKRQQAPAYEAPKFVTVFGAVEKPTPIAFEEGLTVRGAIEKVGGLLKESDGHNVTIEHKVDGQTTTFKENLEDVEKGLAGDRALQPGDSVQVPYKHHSRGPSQAMKIGAAILLGLVLLHP